VLAAYEPVDIVNWGMVAKIDLAEIRGVFVRAGVAVAGVGLVVIFVGGLFFLRGTGPLIGRLETSEARTHAILETVADGVITIDEQGIIVSLGAAPERIFGYAAEEVTGRFMALLAPPALEDEAPGLSAAYSPRRAHRAPRHGSHARRGLICRCSAANLTGPGYTGEDDRHFRSRVRGVRVVLCQHAGR